MEHCGFCNETIDACIWMAEHYWHSCCKLCTHGNHA